MNEDKKEKAAKHIEKELCIAGLNVAYEVRCMLDACEKAVIDEVLEIIDSSIKDVEALTTGREGAISEERKEGMLLEARAIRACAENLKGGDQE